MPEMLARLAFREEGDYVNCYYAPANTMEGAQLVSSMRRSQLNADPTMWEEWRLLMRGAYERFAAAQGIRVDPDAWTAGPGPAHERTGNA